ncbi:MAG TPA: PadR family transcriptional regulator, partial [Gemmatimonadaceae bacterium]|nr:PadR family transcriptional regulator [Gemmatimonadaceae bacterium]
MADADLDLLQGTLDVMILKSLSWGPMHGFGIAKWIRQTTDGVLQIEDSALYPALHRMEHRDWIAAEWGLTENNRRAKYYTLTTKGRQQLRARVASWDRYTEAVTKVVHA